MRNKILSSFTIGDLENPVTAQSIQERLENHDEYIMDCARIREATNRAEDEWGKEHLCKRCNEAEKPPGQILCVYCSGDSIQNRQYKYGTR